ncbi:MAG: hypothetical protein ABJB66_15475 [Gemmatimonadaceae bacterium]
MTSNAQLEQRKIRAKWIGIRGTIGDSKTRQPVSNAIITSSRNKARIVTDSTGHFEVPFEHGETVRDALESSGLLQRNGLIPRRTPCTKDESRYVSPGDKRTAVGTVSVWTRR